MNLNSIFSNTVLVQSFESLQASHPAREVIAGSVVNNVTICKTRQMPNILGKADSLELDEALHASAVLMLGDRAGSFACESKTMKIQKLLLLPTVSSATSTGFPTCLLGRGGWQLGHGRLDLSAFAAY
ncbi:uncharacterized protein CLUP02_07116 [Colletotrichum lupini]|uniref:Uncharacterized protein n=1 Tax=Colletotrichum lupini TaxID=145971 RepID=A0A9Q8SQP0_9PEZI|nr:uncharacterized protein CLUP02_07116 [Colletotrichum lupini]UQC81630.1 hypothetical protein CLUP02_07116 [Colletotrichum lupini]